jgi:hypothetical protein
MYTVSSAPTATAEGLLSRARVAGPPSPLAPGTPVPAIVRMMPSPPHAIEAGVGDVEAAIAADGDGAGIEELGLDGRAAVATGGSRKARVPRPRHRRDEPVGPDPADAPVPPVVDVDAAVRRDGDAIGGPQLRERRRAAVAAEARDAAAGDGRDDPVRADPTDSVA